MLGWILLFAILSLFGAIPLAMGQTQIDFSVKTAVLLSSTLCLLCVLTRLFRRRT